MKILFLHQNFPGQFLHLAPALAARGHEVLALTPQSNVRQSPLPTLRYKYEAPKLDPVVFAEAKTFAEMSHRGKAVARAAAELRDKRGYKPDLIFGHIGWGETLFIKDVFPDARLLTYAEFCYRARGLDTGFDPEFTRDNLLADVHVTARTAHLILAMSQADKALAPTRWQASTFPDHLQSRISVIHDGVDCAALTPDANASVTLEGRTFRAGDEVLTFVNRNLEPYRGYHIFMRALPEVLKARPDAQVVIVGGDGVSYGPRPQGDKSWKDKFLDEVRGDLDLSRVHFVGRVPYDAFVNLMQVSRAHAYLTYPFVLSWSMLEAMACGALIVGSSTAPVTEVIRHNENGVLVDFFDVAGWSNALIDALANPEKYAPLRAAARATITAGYDLQTHCLPRLIEFVEGV